LRPPTQPEVSASTMIPVSTGASASPSTPDVADAPTAPTIHRVSPPNAAAGSPPPKVPQHGAASRIRQSRESYAAISTRHQPLTPYLPCSMSRGAGGVSGATAAPLCLQLPPICRRLLTIVALLAVLLPSAWISTNNCLLYCTHVEKYYCTIFTGNYRMFTLRTSIDKIVRVLLTYNNLRMFLVSRNLINILIWGWNHS
jgi:hypothetical protein